MDTNLYCDQATMKSSIRKRIVLKSWGNLLRVKAWAYSLKKVEELKKSINDQQFIPYGNGRSYGDCALNDVVVQTKTYNKIIDFNPETGIIKCQSGVLLYEILEKVLPTQWFFKVTPGTGYVTIGGAVAADVHGKNHYKEGCFSEGILSLTLLLPNGDTRECSPAVNQDLFRATCGGHGLTGVITAVELQLKRIESAYVLSKTIKTNHLKETLRVFEDNKDATYLVAWLDGFATGKFLGRSLVYIGDHAVDGDFSIKQPFAMRIPFNFPNLVLNKWTMRWFNNYRFFMAKEVVKKVPLHNYFYPLDSIKDWNKVYGKHGFIQYQCVIPMQCKLQGIEAILNTITKSKFTPYLNVLKVLGEANSNFLSFPLKGYTLALDFKISDGLYDFLEELDAIVSSFGGRVYLAKDIRMSQRFFEKSYPDLQEFKQLRKSYKLEQLSSLQSKRLGI